MMSLGILSALIRLLLQHQDLFCSRNCVLFSPRVKFHDELGPWSRQGCDGREGRLTLLSN